MRGALGGAVRKQTRTGRAAFPCARWTERTERRYGRLTVVPSPDAEMLKVPFAVLGV